MSRRVKTPSFPRLHLQYHVPAPLKRSRIDSPKRRRLRHELEERMRYSLVTKTFLAGVTADVLRLRLLHAARVRHKSLDVFLAAKKAAILAGIENERNMREVVFPSIGHTNIRSWNLKVLCIVLKSVKCLDLQEIDDIIYLDKTYRNQFDARFQPQKVTQKQSKEKRQWTKTSGAVQRLIDTAGDSKTIREVRDFICRVDFIPKSSRTHGEKYKRDQLVNIVDDLLVKKQTESENKRKLRSIKRQLTTLSEESVKHTRGVQRPMSAPAGAIRDRSHDPLPLPGAVVMEGIADRIPTIKSILRSSLHVDTHTGMAEVTGVACVSHRTNSAPPTPVPPVDTPVHTIQVESDTEPSQKPIKENKTSNKAAQKRYTTVVVAGRQTTAIPAAHPEAKPRRDVTPAIQTNMEREKPKPTTSGMARLDAPDYGDRNQSPPNYHGYEAKIRQLIDRVLVQKLVGEVASEPLFENKTFIDVFFKYLRHHGQTKSFLRAENAEPHRTWKNLDGTRPYFSFIHYRMFKKILVQSPREESNILLIHKILFRIDCEHDDKVQPNTGTLGVCWRCDQKDLALGISVHCGNYAICQLLVALGTRCKEHHLVLAVKARDIAGVKQMVTFLKQAKCWFPNNETVKRALELAKHHRLPSCVNFLESEGVVDQRRMKHKTLCFCSV